MTNIFSEELKPPTSNALCIYDHFIPFLHPAEGSQGPQFPSCLRQFLLIVVIFSDFIRYSVRQPLCSQYLVVRTHFRTSMGIPWARLLSYSNSIHYCLVLFILTMVNPHNMFMVTCPQHPASYSWEGPNIDMCCRHSPFLAG